MNNDLMFSTKKNSWETPNQFFEMLNKQHNFNWDLAASNRNAKCSKYYTKHDDSLKQDWSKCEGNLFLNPPYGRELKKWVKKAAETRLSLGQQLVMLIPARTDTSYWHDYIFGKAEIIFLRGRLKFELNGVSKDAAPFPSALVTYEGGKTHGGSRSSLHSTISQVSAFQR
ncbi:phage N-6-adenine-methyltransferase [Liquorilactobacillus capillatus]|uniref:Phage N-6-adenine-methyltransferase n=1 Tax=Liquorilactobacillus capillatus DSM 19910 TaxID=1423731 RepID=A0A0R1MDW0_9LACO|nr:phage N-6-adenine-methyltransferase [Liquorilactobacillus capillatus]KRL02507.1 phage N-6-adenine-methyltransferase [Liquorilactobacillus capillatus DSM 19910]